MKFEILSLFLSVLGCLSLPDYHLPFSHSLDQHTLQFLLSNTSLSSSLSLSSSRSLSPSSSLSSLFDFLKEHDPYSQDRFKNTQKEIKKVRKYLHIKQYSNRTHVEIVQLFFIVLNECILDKEDEEESIVFHYDEKKFGVIQMTFERRNCLDLKSISYQLADDFEANILDSLPNFSLLLPGLFYSQFSIHGVSLMRTRYVKRQSCIKDYQSGLYLWFSVENEEYSISYFENEDCFKDPLATSTRFPVSAPNRVTSLRTTTTYFPLSQNTLIIPHKRIRFFEGEKSLRLVFVGVGDDNVVTSNCSSFSDGCSLRSAISACFSLDIFDECQIIIPPIFPVIEVNPITFGSIQIPPAATPSTSTLFFPLTVTIVGSKNMIQPVPSEGDSTFLVVNPLISGAFIDSFHLSNLTIRGFRSSSSSQGGSITLAKLKSASLTEIHFLANQGTLGGALFVLHTRELLFRRTSGEQNSASFGGVVYLDSCEHILFDQVEFMRNLATNDGGALYFGNDQRNITFVNSMFHSNMASKNGGSIFFESSNTDVFFLQTTIANNTAVAGGGMFWSDQNSNVLIQFCSIVDNSASSLGGGLYFESNNLFTVSSSNFLGNDAVINGGGLYLGSRNHFCSVEECTFSQNIGIENGGAIYLESHNYHFRISQSSFTLNEGTSGGAVFINSNNYFCEIDSTQFIANLAQFGSGFGTFEYNYAAYIHDSVFANNFAYYGGGLLLYRDLIGAIVENCHFSQNYAYYFGGGYYLALITYNSSINNCTFVENFAGADGGGVFLLQFNDGFTITNSLFHSNVASFGGGIYFDNRNNYVMITSSSFIRNVGTNMGGGILFAKESTEIILSELHLIENQAGRGGAIVLDGSISAATLVGLQISHNSADSYGGGILVGRVSSDISIISCNISHNTAQIYGGGIHMNDESNHIFVHESLLYSNSANYGGGIMLYSENTNITISYSNLTANRAIFMGGAIAVMIANKNIYITSCSISGNMAGNLGGGVYISMSNFNINFMRVYVTENYGLLGGGGIYVAENNQLIRITQGKFYLNTAPSGNGGAIFSMASRLAMNNCQLITNSAVLGGGLFLSGSDLWFELMLAVNNSAVSGGAIYIMSSGETMIRNCKFIRNIAFEAGGLLIDSTTELTIISSNFEDNRATMGSGGGILAKNWVGGNLLDTKFENNFAKYSGGAMKIEISSFDHISNCQFNQNRAEIGSGGALFLEDTFSRIMLSLIKNNTALLGGGGGIYWKYTPLSARTYSDLVDQNDFSDNTATYGSDYASSGMSIAVSELHSPFSSITTLEVESYRLPLPSLEVRFLDYYQHVCTLENNSVVQVSAIGEFECGDMPEQISGSTIAAITEGIAQFDELSARCIPGGGMKLAFSMTAANSLLSTEIEVRYRRCRRGEIYATGDCLTCPIGSYSLQDNTNNTITSCDPCPMHATECYGDTIAVEEGFWRYGEMTTPILQCPYRLKACNGGNVTGDLSCALGYEGPLCAICARNYYPNAFTRDCSVCPENGMSPSSIVVIAVAVFCCFLFLYMAVRRGDDMIDEDMEQSFREAAIQTLMKVRSSLKQNEIDEVRELREQKLREKLEVLQPRLKIFIALLQIFSSMKFNLSVPFPPFFSSLLQLSSWVNLVFADTISVKCLRELNYIQHLLLTTLLPIAFLTLLFLCYQLLKWYLNNSRAKRSHFDRLYSLSMHIFLVFTYLILPGISMTIVQMFSCDNVDPNEEVEGAQEYMTADYSISCSSSFYHSGRKFAIGMIFVYPIGIPLIYFFLLYSIKSVISDPDQSNLSSELLIKIAPFKFLYDSYSSRYWYWEVVETIRRIVLTSLLVMGGVGTSQKLVLSMIACLVFMKLYGSHAVFEDEILNSDIEVAQYQIFFIFFLSLLANEGVVDASSLYVSALYGIVFFSPLSALCLRSCVDINGMNSIRKKNLIAKYVTPALPNQQEPPSPRKQFNRSHGRGGKSQALSTIEEHHSSSLEITIPIPEGKDAERV